MVDMDAAVQTQLENESEKDRQESRSAVFVAALDRARKARSAARRREE